MERDFQKAIDDQELNDEVYDYLLNMESSQEEEGNYTITLESNGTVIITNDITGKYFETVSLEVISERQEIQQRANDTYESMVEGARNIRTI